MKEITVLTVSRKLEISPQVIYKWLGDRKANPENLAAVLVEESLKRQIKSTKYREMSIKYSRLSQQIKDAIKETV